MTILHSGTSKQYSANWSQAFGKGKETRAAKASEKAGAKKKPAAKKKAAKKSAKK